MSDDVLKTKIENLGYCIKSKDWTVQWQNKDCESICGDQKGRICEKNCHKYALDNSYQSETGSHLFKAKEIDGHHFDVVVLTTEDEIVSVLLPVQKKVEEATKFYQDQGLTPREIEIMNLRDQDLSHRQIREKLFISESTLKTHINNIHAKLKQGRSAA